MDAPETRYTKTADGVHIGYQVFGSGSIDLVFLPGDYSNIEAVWDLNPFVSFAEGLAAHARVLLLDRRGMGVSDRAAGVTNPTLEVLMDDIRAVMDAAGSERACLLGLEVGTRLCFLFAATYPERTAGLIAFGGTARGLWVPDHPWIWTEEQWATWLDWLERAWGTPPFVQELVELVSPSLADDAGFVRAFGRYLRLAASPGEAVARDIIDRDTDVRDVLPTIQVPTMVIHRVDDRLEPVDWGRYIAEHIPGASYVELPGDNHGFPYDDAVPHIARFLGSIRDEEAEFDRVLATVLFTDIVDSTAASAAMGDRTWGDVRAQHDRIARAAIARYRGREIKTMGDGFLATFDGPARGVRCAKAIEEQVKKLGIEVRAGLHTGEVAFENDDVTGIAVAIGARVGAKAGASEVLVSQTVKDLVAGSGLAFEDAGEHELKGVPDRWKLYRVVA